LLRPDSTAAKGLSRSIEGALGGASPEPAPDAAVRFNDPQRRSLSVGLHHVADLLDEVQRVLDAAATPSPFSRLTSDVSPAQSGVVRDHLERLRRTLLAAARRHGLDVAGPALDARRSIGAQLTAAAIAVAEIRPRHLRGYGSLDPGAAEELDRTCDELERLLRELQLSVDRGPEEDYEARLARLGESAEDPRLLATLERAIREHGLVAHRAMLASVLERLDAGAAVARVRAADGGIAEARAELDRVAAASENDLEEVLAAAAGAILAGWRAGGARRIDSAPPLAAALDAIVRRRREQVVAALGALDAALEAAAREIDPRAAEVFTARPSGPDLTGLPVLDAAAVVGTMSELVRPVLARAVPRWTARRIAGALRERHGPALRQALRAHGHRLRELGQRAVTRLADAFHHAVAPFAAAVEDRAATPATPAEPAERRRLEADLAALSAFESRPPESAG
jgi:hypothetical protein